MFRISIKATAVLMSLFLFSACWNVVEGDRPGWLSINLSQDTSEDIIFKSLTEPENGQEFKLEFVRKGELVKTISHVIGEESDPIELPVGPYVVKASTGDNDEAAFNEPFYMGEEEIDIVAETEHTMDITCFLSNVKVTVDFAQEIIDGFSEYQVKVTNSRGGTLTFADETLSQAGYFKVEKGETLQWELTLVNNNGVKYTASDKYVDVLPKEHYNLTFSLGEASPELGGMYLTIRVDDSTEVKLYAANVDFSGNEGPSISVNDEFQELLDNGSVPFGVLDDKVVTMTASKGLKSAVIRHADEKLYAAGLPYYTDLVGITQAQLSDLSQIGIKTSAYSYGTGDPVIVDITYFMANLDMDSSYSFNISIYDVYNHMADLPIGFTVVVDAAADMVSVQPGAETAVVKGRWFVDPIPAGLTFWYKMIDDLAWMSVDLGDVQYDAEDKTMTAMLTDLQPGATYLVKAVSDSDTDTREMEFETISPQLYNMGFEYWNVSGKMYYPYPAGATSAQMVWDCANKALTDFGQNSSTTYVTDHVVEGSRAARMESKSVMGIAFAAGNIYTGAFQKVITSGGTGASLKWGTEFAHRPVALRGSYDYKSTVITDAKAPYLNMKGQPDKCQILVFLTDWEEQFDINTVEGKFVDFNNDEHIIALGRLESSETTGGYVEFCIPLEYRSDRIPKYVVISCTSSALGDYFTGGVGSTLYIDDFKFEYDLSTLSEEDQAKVNY